MRNTRPARWGCCQIFQPTRKEINFSCCLNYWLKKKFIVKNWTRASHIRNSLQHHCTTKLIRQATEKLSYITQTKEKIIIIKKLVIDQFLFLCFRSFHSFFLFHYNINHLLPFLMSRNLFKDYSARLFVYNISFLAAQNSTANPICSFFFIPK